MRPLLVASHNRGKAVEIANLVRPLYPSIRFSWEVSLDDIEETGVTYVQNAVLKAQNAAKQLGVVSIADDCGLDIVCLENKPGIYSKRYAKQLGSWQEAMCDLVEQTKGRNKESYFCCAIAIAWPSGQTLVEQYRLKGQLVHPRGELGFGYDACFLPDGYTKTFGEMTPDFRNAINHRANAFSKLQRHIDWRDCSIKSELTVQ